MIKIKSTNKSTGMVEIATPLHSNQFAVWSRVCSFVSSLKIVKGQDKSSLNCTYRTKRKTGKDYTFVHDGIRG